MAITPSTYKLSDFLDWQTRGLLELSPHFQRRPVWRPGAKSYLVDTVLRGYPMPPIYLRDIVTDLKSLNTKREVVDGQQRLRTLLGFVKPDCLPDFDPDLDNFKIKRVHQPSLANKSFEQLPNESRQRILDYKFHAMTFSAETDDRQILEIFSRMNSTGVSLNKQELRNAKYYGEFKSIAYELGVEHYPFWIDREVFTPIQIARMDEIEMASDIMILIMDGITAKTASTIESYYQEYDEVLPGAEIIKRRFRHCMDVMAAIDIDEFVTLLSARAMFYAAFAVVYHLSWGLESELRRTKPHDISSKKLNAILARANEIFDQDAPQEVLEAKTRRTTHASNRDLLINYLLE